MGFGHHRQVGLPSTETLVPAEYGHSLNRQSICLAARWDGICPSPNVLFRAQQLEQTPRAPGHIVEIPELPECQSVDAGHTGAYRIGSQRAPGVHRSLMFVRRRIPFR